MSVKKELRRIKIQNVIIPDSDPSEDELVIPRSKETDHENSEILENTSQHENVVIKNKRLNTLATCKISENGKNDLKLLESLDEKHTKNSKTSQHEIQQYYLDLRRDKTVCSKVPIRNSVPVKVLAMGQTKKIGKVNYNQESTTTVKIQNLKTVKFSGKDKLETKLLSNEKSSTSLQGSHSDKQQIVRPRKLKYIYVRRLRWEGRFLKRKYVLPLRGYSRLDVIRSP